MFGSGWESGGGGDEEKTHSALTHTQCQSPSLMLLLRARRHWKSSDSAEGGQSGKASWRRWYGGQQSLEMSLWALSLWAEAGKGGRGTWRGLANLLYRLWPPVFAEGWGHLEAKKMLMGVIWSQTD